MSSGKPMAGMNDEMEKAHRAAVVATFLVGVATMGLALLGVSRG